MSRLTTASPRSEAMASASTGAPLFESGRPGPVSRRSFLRGAGTLLTLPLLESATTKASLGWTAEAEPVLGTPRRMLAICNNLGLLPDRFFPEGEGNGYVASPYLQRLARHRDQLTVFSGVSHPEVDGGHPADNCFLTAAPHPGRPGFRNTISLDQRMAEHIGHLTRSPSLTLGVNVSRGRRSLSWNSSGVLIPCEERPSAVFEALFLGGPEDLRKRRIERLETGQSILDAVTGQARRVRNQVSHRDRERLDQYFTSVRELEGRLEQARAWEQTPRPVVDEPMPQDPESPREYMHKVRLMYDMARLAFETDSTRLITLMLDSVNSPAIEVDGETVSDGYHNLSHHGQRPEKLAQLEEIDTAHMDLLATLFDDLRLIDEGGQTLLDRTMILYGTNLGNAHTHSTTNLPTLFAGGGFRHGQHLVYDLDYNYPLPNLFVSMLQRMGIPADRFASSTGTMTGLEFA